MTLANFRVLWHAGARSKTSQIGPESWCHSRLRYASTVGAGDPQTIRLIVDRYERDPKAGLRGMASHALAMRRGAWAESFRTQGCWASGLLTAGGSPLDRTTWEAGMTMQMWLARYAQRQLRGK